MRPTHGVWFVVARPLLALGAHLCAVPWAPWLLFTGVPGWCVALRVRCPGPLGTCSPLCPFGVLRCLCGVLGYLAPVHRCARSVRCLACAVSWATWLLFRSVLARRVALRVRCPRPLSSCSPVCSLGALCCVCGVLGHLAPVYRCAHSVCCAVCAMSWATWLLFIGVLARCVMSRVRFRGPLGSCSPVCSLGVLCRVCGVLGHLAPVHRMARSARCVACTVSWATWLLFTGWLARCIALGVCDVQGHLAVVHRCARSVCCVACAVSGGTWLQLTGVPACALSRATWLLFTCVLARHVVLRVRCPWPLGSCSPVCSLGALCRVCDVLGHLAPVHQGARSAPCVA